MFNQGTIESCCFTYIDFTENRFYYLLNDSTDTSLKNRKMSTNNFNRNYVIISTILVSDSDSNEEALQEANIEEDESVEGEVDRHVAQGTIKSCCFT